MEENNNDNDNKDQYLNQDNINLNDMNIDQIIINLKIIALIKKHEKLSVREEDKSLIIDPQFNFLYFQSFKRWLNQDNRQKTMTYIHKIINKTFEWMDKTYDEYKHKEDISEDIEISPEIFEESKENLLLRISKEVINAAEGLKNLRITYKNDSRINSEIQLLLDKIKIKVDKINSALNVKWIIDKEYQSNSQYGD